KTSPSLLSHVHSKKRKRPKAQDSLVPGRGRIPDYWFPISRYLQVCSGLQAQTRRHFYRRLP
ncbi:hypothetical protein AVEN_9215-1, partial [Araneus ventricosus]